MRFFQRLKIGIRLAVGAGLALLVLAVTAVLAAVEIGHANDDVKTFGASTMPSLKAVALLRTGLQDLRRAQAGYLVAHDQAGRDEAEHGISRARDRLETALAGYDALVLDDEERRRSALARAAYEDVLQLWRPLRHQARQADSDPEAAAAVQRAFFGESQEAFIAARDRIDRMWEYDAQLEVQRSARLQGHHANALRLLAALAGIACLACIGVAWAIARSITVTGPSRAPAGDTDLSPAADRPPADPDSPPALRAARPRAHLAVIPAPAGSNL